MTRPSFILAILLYSITCCAQVPYKHLDILPGKTGSEPFGFLAHDGRMYFYARDENYNKTLWSSNGTDTGTHKIKKLGQGMLSNLSVIKFPSNAYHKFFFEGDDTLHGAEIWESDGTAAGTHVLKDIYPGKQSSACYGYCEYKNKLYFSARSALYTTGIWVTDGTTNGTQLIKSFGQGMYGSNVGGIVAYNNKMYFLVNEYTLTGIGNVNLWESDGTPTGTKIVKSLPPDSFTFYCLPVIFRGKIIFTASDTTHGMELWQSDGTATGTMLLKDIRPGTGRSAPVRFFATDSLLYFAASDSDHNEEPWVTDGTTIGTRMLKDINPGNKNSSPSDFYEYNHKVYFFATSDISGCELWVSDGTQTGTVMFNDFNPGSQSSWPAGFFEYRKKMYFSANNGTGSKLYETDGTPVNTQPTGPAWATKNNPAPANFCLLDTIAFFAADFDSTGREVWIMGLSELIKTTDTDTTIIVIPNEKNEALFSIYPNPANGHFTIATQEKYEIGTVSISSISGNIVYRQSITGLINTITLSGLQKGLYTVTVTLDKKKATLRLCAD